MLDVKIYLLDLDGRQDVSLIRGVMKRAGTHRKWLANYLSSLNKSGMAGETDSYKSGMAGAFSASIDIWILHRHGIWSGLSEFCVSTC